MSAPAPGLSARPMGTDGYAWVECPVSHHALFRARGPLDIEIRCRCKRLLHIWSPHQIEVLSD